MEETIDDFKQNKTTSYTNCKGDIEITFIENLYDPDHSDTSYEATFIYLIRRKGDLKIHTDRHLCGIFRLDILVNLLREIGFEVNQLKYELPESAIEYSSLVERKDYPMFVCIRPF